MEGVGVGSDHHHHSLQGVRPATELGPVDAILVPAAVVASAVPHAVQVGVGAGVIPPATLLVMGTVTWGRGNKGQKGAFRGDQSLE